MNRELLAALVENVRRRASEGDHPVTPAYPVETLENAIIDLAKVSERGQSEMSSNAPLCTGSGQSDAPAEQGGERGWSDWPRKTTDLRYEVNGRPEWEPPLCPFCENTIDQTSAVVVIGGEGLYLAHEACLPEECADAILAALQAAPADPVAGVGEADWLTKCLQIANANGEKFERLWYLEKDKFDRLKLAICGGEDVPGAIEAVSVEDCEGFIAEERSRHNETEDSLHKALLEVRESIKTYPLDDTATCMCGSPVEGHNVGSGHSPVSQADHAISLIVESIDKALGIAAALEDALGAGRPDDYEGPDAGMHDTEIAEDDND